MSPRSAPLALLVIASLVLTACGSSQGTSAPSTGGGGASAPAASSGGSPAESAAGGSAASSGKPISGTLQVGAKYGCKPIPCKPAGEGAADEIATTRYDV